MAVGQSVLPIATRHLTPGVVDADCVAVTKRILAAGSRDVGGAGGWPWTTTTLAVVERDASLSSLWCRPCRHLVSKLSFFSVGVIPQTLKKIMKLVFKNVI